MLVLALSRNFKQQQSFKKDIDINHDKFEKIIKYINQERTLHYTH